MLLHIRREVPQVTVNDVKDNWERLQHTIHYSFNDISFLENAMTHSSYSNEKHMPKDRNNERLEFLGDAVLELISSNFLFHSHPEEPEGILTKLRSSMVCEMALAFCARRIYLGSCILLGRGEDMTGGRERESVTSDALEALIGAIYLDSGLDSAAAFITEHILSDVENRQLFIDSKTILQEMVQADMHGSLHYVLDGEEGPDHNKKFFVSAMIGETEAGRGCGRTKKAAEQDAAYNAIMKLREQKDVPEIN